MTRAKRRTPVCRVADDDGEVERQVADVRKRVRGIDRERREDGEDPSSNTSLKLLALGLFRSSQSVIRTPPARSSGWTSLLEEPHLRATSSCARPRIASICSRGLMPSGDVPDTPGDELVAQPETRIWKNSSRLRLKIATNCARSSAGRARPRRRRARARCSRAPKARG